MRTLFLVLMLANLAFFAWTRYLAPKDPGTDPQPLARQIEPAKLGILGAEAPPGAALRKPAASGEVLACIEWGGFPGAELERAQKALEPLALGARLSERKVEDTASWWVFMPPQGSRQNAQRKAAELRALGENDYFIVQDDARTRWSISLGIYSTEDAAQARLAALRDKGVRTAQIGQRELQVARTWLQVRNVDGALLQRLGAVALDFAGTELRECQPG